LCLHKKYPLVLSGYVPISPNSKNFVSIEFYEKLLIKADNPWDGRKILGTEGHGGKEGS
jgi:hypothetical protein